MKLLSLNNAVRAVLALVALISVSVFIIIKVDIPNWYVVIVSTVVAFYFGHVNGHSEAQNEQNGQQK